MELKIPNHVGIIVDGNGRWAKEKGLARSMGHKAGSERLEKSFEYMLNKGIKVISAYVFSTENFKRSKEEVDYLMKLLLKKIELYQKKYMQENIKIVISGRRENLSTEINACLDDLVEKTKNNTKAIINFCFNYGGRAEIIDTTKKIAELYKEGKIKDIDENTFEKHLYNELPPIDLLIRTSGEMRVSNFMLWQLAYAEFYFPQVYFPDFDENEIDKALLAYNNRDRRFGGINYES
jgi:undecaprenyl diphosphate synthase